MEKIDRPKKVSKLDKQILSKKNFEENADNQFNKIYDYLDEVHEEMNKPQETDKIISNSNGTAVKFLNGTMICRKTITFSKVEFIYQQGNLYFCPLLNLGVMPEKFTEIPFIYPTCPTASGLISGVRYSSVNSFGQVQLYRGNDATQENVTIEVMAIGKWK